jgi:hypothetical protein
MLALAAIFAALPLLPGCTSGGAATSVSISIVPSSKVSLDQGQTTTFMATVTNDLSNSGVTWEVYTSKTGTNTITCSLSSCGTLSNTTPFNTSYTSPTGFLGPETITLQASSVVNSKIIATVTLDIVLAPVINTLTLPSGENGVPYSQSISVTGGVPPLSYSVISGKLPAGLSLGSNGAIGGTPSSFGTSQFTVQVADNGTPPLTVTQLYTITVAPAPPLSVANIELPEGLQGTPYSGTVAVTGGIPPLMWTLQGNLPPGLSLQTNTTTKSTTGVTTGTITGTPTQTGTTTFTISVQDSAIPFQTASQQLSITINPSSSIQITTQTLPGGVVAQGYGADVQTTGGNAPISFSVTQGLLPPGLNLNPSDGTITGTPSRVGTSAFTIEATDSSTPPVSASATYSIAVVPNSVVTMNNLLLSGPYAFLFNGFGVAGSNQAYPETVVGTITFNGTGGITSGTEDIHSTTAREGLAITGSYTMGSDGRGAILTSVTGPAGQVLTQTYELEMDAEGNANFVETDNTGNRGVGILQKQSSTAFTSASFSGKYAFYLLGYDASLHRTATVGQFNADGSSTINPATVDINDFGIPANYSGVTGSFGGVGGTGRGDMTLFITPNQQSYVFYIVSPQEVFFISTVTTDQLGTQTISPPQSGIAYRESSNSLDATDLNGNYVATGTGLDGSSGDSSAFASLQTLASSSTASGEATPLTFDQNDGGTVSSSLPAAASYTVDSTGRVAFSGGTERIRVGYLVSPSLTLFIGTDPDVTFGRLELQTPESLFGQASVQGQYTLGEAFLVDGQATTIAGVPAADGFGNLSGAVDFVTASGTQTLDQALSGTYIVASNTGRGVLTPASGDGLPATLALYVLSPTQVRLVSIDSTDSHPQNFTIAY